MTTEVKVPALPESVADATLVNWHKKVGDFVQEGENLVDLETDKVVLELPAPVSGVLKAITVEDGSTVTGGDVVATMEAGEAPTVQAPATPAQETKSTASAPKEDNKNASPAARKMAAEAGVNTAEMTGSGRGGR